MFYSTRTDERLNVESKKYVDTVLPIILKSFDANEFIKFAAPEFLKSVPEKRIFEIFNVYKKLGGFKKYLGSKGKAKTSIAIFKGKKWVYAKYTAKAEFANGLAVIKITIIKEKGKWFIYHIKIDSKVFNSDKKTKNNIKQNKKNR
jgi:hypothetical protein